ADVPIADDSLAIHQDRGRPGPDAPALPDRELVVLHDRISDPEFLRGVHDTPVRLLPGEFRAVHSDDREPVLLVTLVPAPQLRDHVLAVDSTEGPELDQHDPAAQARRGQGPAVDPALPCHFRRRHTDTNSLARGGTRRQDPYEDERRDPPHGYCFFSIVLSPCIILSSFIMAFSSFFMSSDFISPFISPFLSPFIIVSSDVIGLSLFFGPSVWATDWPTTPGARRRLRPPRCRASTRATPSASASAPSLKRGSAQLRGD